MNTQRFLVAALLVGSMLDGLDAQQLKDLFDTFDYNRRLGQAVNLGNALEAPHEGDWGLTLKSYRQAWQNDWLHL